MGSLMKNLVQAAPLGSMLNEVLNSTETDVSLKDVVQKFVSVGNAVKNELVDKAVGGVRNLLNTTVKRMIRLKVSVGIACLTFSNNYSTLTSH